MFKKMLGLYFKTLFILAFALLASGCSSWFPESWNDPAYFGPDEDLGKHNKGIGTGYETWQFDVYDTNTDPSAE